VDDAGVYQVSEDMALVQTVDFFPPIVDDPFVFGQVAAANALSDVYAMGGRPITALNILAVPATMPYDQVGEVLRGGASKIIEAGAVIAGGHSIKDTELKYGLAVTGLIHPRKIMANSGAKAGDVLILTKPIGTGIVATAVKRNRAKPEEEAAAIAVMITLNKTAGESMAEYGTHAATDITGFGLAGHAYEMAHASGVTLEIEYNRLHILPGVAEYARAGIRTGGANANREYLKDKVSFASGLDLVVGDIVFDPQTSGGMLMALPPDRAAAFVDYLISHQVDAVVIGRALPAGAIPINIK
jgi:selenide, water dikinase